MNLRYILKGSLTLAIALLTMNAWAEHDELNPNIQQVKPGDTVKVTHIPGKIYLRSQNDPDDLIWDRVPIYSTNLLPAPPVHQIYVLLRARPAASIFTFRLPVPMSAFISAYAGKITLRIAAAAWMISVMALPCNTRLKMSTPLI